VSQVNTFAIELPAEFPSITDCTTYTHQHSSYHIKCCIAALLLLLLLLLLG